MHQQQPSHHGARSHPSLSAPKAKRLEELDKVYRDEVVARKRAHNALEDAKGKIRVFARIRPLLDFEAARKQVRGQGRCRARDLGAKAV